MKRKNEAAINSLYGSGLGPDEISLALDRFRKQGYWGYLMKSPKIPLSFKPGLAQHIDEYHRLRKLGLNHMQAQDSVTIKFKNAKEKLIRMGVPELLASKVSEQYDADDFLKLWHSGFRNEDEIYSVLEKVDSDSYIVLRKAGLTHDMALSRAEEFETPSVVELYKALPNLGNDEVREVLSADNVNDYIKFRKAEFSHEESMVLSEKYSADDFLKVKNGVTGISIDEVKQALDSAESADQYVFYRQLGFDSESAIKFSDTFHQENFKAAINAGMPKEEVAAFLESNRLLNVALELRNKGFSSKNADKIQDDYSVSYALWLRNLGASENEIMEVFADTKFDSLLYGLSRKSGSSHEVALEFSRHSDLSDSGILRRLGFNSTEVDDAVETYDVHELGELVAGGANPKEAMEILDEGHDIGDYISLRMKIKNHEQSTEVLSSYDVEEYLALRSDTRVSHVNAIEVLDNGASASDYFNLRKDGNVSHSEALELLNEGVDEEEYLKLRSEKSVSHHDALAVIYDYDIDDYLSYRRAGKSHNQSLELLDE
jgi:adenylate cyclase class IV